MKRYFLIFIGLLFASLSFGQDEEKPLVVVDDIQIDVKDVSLSPKGDTAIVELFLISYQKNPREFKLNTFASGVVDSQGKPYLYASIQMGKVRLNLEDKQNYLHYLLEQDLPVLLRIKTAAWTQRWGKPKQLNLTFEDSTEEGKFLEVGVDL
jgi:hypothetical protein